MFKYICFWREMDEMYAFLWGGGGMCLLLLYAYVFHTQHKSLRENK